MTEFDKILAVVLTVLTIIFGLSLYLIHILP